MVYLGCSVCNCIGCFMHYVYIFSLRLLLGLRMACVDANDFDGVNDIDGKTAVRTVIDRAIELRLKGNNSFKYAQTLVEQQSELNSVFVYHKDAIRSYHKALIELLAVEGKWLQTDTVSPQINLPLDKSTREALHIEVLQLRMLIKRNLAVVLLKKLDLKRGFNQYVKPPLNEPEESHVLQRALTLVNEVLDIDSQNKDARLMKGRIYCSLGETEVAKDVLTSLLNDAPETKTECLKWLRRNAVLAKENTEKFALTCRRMFNE